MKKKKALICNLGGTIGMVPNENGALRPPENDEDFKKAVQSITSLEKFKDVDFEFVTLSTKDSTDLCPEEWEEFVSYVNKRQKEFDFVICPHGTDTMVYTASAFSFGFYDPETRGSKLFTPIIFTGAQKPLYEPGGDGEKNLISAIETGIKADEENITDVLITFDNVVVQAVKAYKTSDHRYNAFDSVDGVHIGTVSALGVTLHNANLAITSEPLHRQQMAMTYKTDRPPPNGKFTININDEGHKAKGYVADITLHPGVTEKSIEAHTKDPNCLGIMMTSLGAGNIPEKVIDHIANAVEKYHMPIFSVSPFVGGAVHAHMYEAAERAQNAGVAFPGDQSSSTAWVKAHWILANGLGKTSRDFILNMQRVFRQEGQEDKDSEIVPEKHITRAKDKRNDFRSRLRRNYTAIERYRREKGNDFRFISLNKKSEIVSLPKADAEVFNQKSIKPLGG